MLRIVIILALLGVVVAGCGGAAGDAATVTPEFTATPSPTPLPTATPKPTSTPAPTPTATPEPACSTKDGNKVYDLLRTEGQRWDDAADLANSTPRMQLASQIASLQEIRRDIQNADWPECAVPAKDAMVGAMDAAINGFIAFLADKPDSEVQALFDEYSEMLDRFFDEMSKLQ